ncbi:MAG: hypothetical protein H6739_38150 [Alphaproteobacteria bacterium]|nr:hypothetical protein [Alphaproteobacteria bacterium]
MFLMLLLACGARGDCQELLDAQAACHESAGVAVPELERGFCGGPDRQDRDTLRCMTEVYDASPCDGPDAFIDITLGVDFCTTEDL